MSSLIDRQSRFFAVCFGLLLLLTFAPTASAQWWRFGSDSGQPELSELLFNNINAWRVDRSLHFSLEDLDNHKVTVRGRAEVGQGKIGRVEASLDNGVTWTAIPIGERGLFAFTFIPEIEHPYQFKIRALSTTGQSSDEAEHAFEFKVVREDNRALAKAAFQRLLERYMARDRSGFMRLVSRDFIGNESALDSALSNDFRFFDAIRIQPTVQRMAMNGDRWMIYFSFNRQVRSVRNGQMLQDQAYTSVTLIREDDGYKLYELAAPLIFGVSDPANVATSVAAESVGKSVLVLDSMGNVSTQRQGQDTQTQDGAASNIREGGFMLQLQQGFSFRTASVVSAMGGDNYAVGMTGFHVNWGSEVEAVQLLTGVSSVSAVTSVPETLDDQRPGYLNVGSVVALRLSDGTYAIIGLVSQGGPDGPWNFQYRHQRNGTTSFR